MYMYKPQASFATALTILAWPMALMYLSPLGEKFFHLFNFTLLFYFVLFE